jgi:2-phospho-L-lactate guanylyltransferase (CobY/MobA/RfbA family)
VSRRAVLLFAEKTHVDLARRSFPMAARPLLNLPAFASEFSPAIDVHLFTSAGNAGVDSSRIHRQSGRGFAERFENAIETIAQLGYDEVVAVGRDCPGLRALDIEHAFAELASKKLVLGPDHRGGCYLIAFRTADRELLRDVRWKRNTDCAQLLERGGAAHVFLLPVKQDLDSWSDLRIFARGGGLLARFASFLLDLFSVSHRQIAPFVSFAAQHMRERQQMPPPAFVA